MNQRRIPCTRIDPLPGRMHILAAAVLSLLTGTAPADPGWISPLLPAPGLAHVYGGYAAGCLAGAEALPLIGTGYQVMRPSRNRYYGHPSLTGFVRRFGRQAAMHGHRLLIGDLSQPRGGPMPYGHSSHQNGLDVDVWFEFLDGTRILDRRVSESRPLRSVLDRASGRPDALRFNGKHRNDLRAAAADPQVERIFVHPSIKRALCASETQDRHWLGKLRPWWGHDDHYHVRLQCPPGSSHCVSQAPPPPGDGCGEDLANWERDARIAASRPSRPHPRRDLHGKLAALPSTCTALLNLRNVSAHR